MNAFVKLAQPAGHDLRLGDIGYVCVGSLVGLCRRLLDVIKDELDRRAAIHSMQALLPYDFGAGELAAAEPGMRGYHLGPNISPTMKNMVEMGYE
jgi:hypothetical protein